jgi:acetylornithine deacetylase/succinyl-diaminopimelate desuccinylase-like protein
MTFAQLDALSRRADVARAFDWIRGTDGDTLADMVAAAQIPAPSGHERERAAWFRTRLHDAGFEEADLDAAGNVIARWSPSPSDDDRAIVLASHLDTVFPAGTDLTVVVQDGVRRAPGIADNARGLAALLALARALRFIEWSPRRPVAFVGTVGEEGAGDLRGVKHLLREGAPLRRARAFIAVDGSGRRQIVNRALGAVRLRFEVAGPGGHSWADRGRVNPLAVLARAMVSWRAQLPPDVEAAPTRMAGGEAINAIPTHAWLEVDVRGRSPHALAEATDVVRRAVLAAVAEANGERRRGTAELRASVRMIGDRPIGSTPEHAELVRVAAAATRALGEEPEFSTASTDANIPLALGIPAIALGAGGRSGATHTTAEWYCNEGGPEGIQRLLLMLVALAG